MPGRWPTSVAECAQAFERGRHVACQQRNLGLTSLYNDLHDPTIQLSHAAELRALQLQLDLAVRDAYGWTDLDLGHGFHAVPYLPENDRIRYTISEPARLEVLRRLSKLNRERWQAEQGAAAPPNAATVQTAGATRLGRPQLTPVSPPHQPDMFNT